MRSEINSFPDGIDQLQVFKILREIVEAAKQRKRITQGCQRGPAKTGGCARPGLLAQLDHNAIRRFFDTDGQRSLSAGHGARPRGDLDIHFVAGAHGLRAQVCPIKFRQERLGYFGGCDVSVENSSVHNSIIILSCILSKEFTHMTRMSFTQRIVPLPAFLLLLPAGLLALLFAFSTQTVVRAQFVISCAAAPGSSIDGPYVTVNADQDHVNVRSGPNSYLYDKVGILYPFESALALGRSPGSEWIQIACPGAPGGVGWVYAANVTLTSTGFLTVVEPPASPTPPAPPTLDPTLAALFPSESTPTRLPTFTPAAPVTVPVFADVERTNTNAGLTVPLAGGLLLLGFLFLLVSFFVRR